MNRSTEPPQRKDLVTAAANPHEDEWAKTLPVVQAKLSFFSSSQRLTFLVDPHRALQILRI